MGQSLSSCRTQPAPAFHDHVARPVCRDVWVDNVFPYLSVKDCKALRLVNKVFARAGWHYMTRGSDRVWMDMDRCAQLEGKERALDMARQFLGWIVAQSCPLHQITLQREAFPRAHVQRLNLDLVVHKDDSGSLLRLPSDMSVFPSVRRLALQSSWIPYRPFYFSQSFPSRFPALEHIEFVLTDRADQTALIWPDVFVFSLCALGLVRVEHLKYVTWSIPSHFETGMSDSEEQRYSGTFPLDLLLHDMADTDSGMSNRGIQCRIVRKPDIYVHGRLSIQQAKRSARSALDALRHWFHIDDILVCMHVFMGFFVITWAAFLSWDAGSANI